MPESTSALSKLLDKLEELSRGNNQQRLIALKVIDQLRKSGQVKTWWNMPSITASRTKPTNQ